MKIYAPFAKAELAGMWLSYIPKEYLSDLSGLPSGGRFFEISSPEEIVEWQLKYRFLPITPIIVLRTNEEVRFMLCY